MKAVLIFVSLLFCSVYTYSQWVDMGFPDSKVTYVRPIGDSLLYFTTSDKILTSHIGNPNWQTVLEIDEEYSVLTLDSRRFYINTNDGQFSFDRITREHTDLQLSHLDLPTMIFHSGFGLVARDTSEQAVMYSADNGLTWDTLMSIEDITTVPENSRIRKITQDIHGNLFVIYKSNWQYHLLVVSKGRRPVELTNNWYGYSDIIMDQDSTVYYTDGHGLHFLERGEKYEKDIFLEIQGDTFHAQNILYADGDSIIVSSYDQVYGSGELGANGKKLFDLWQLRWASFESPGIVLGRNYDCAPFSRFTIFNLNSNRLTFDTVGLGPLFGHIDLHHLPEQPLCNTACGFYQKRYSNRHWSIERTMDDLVNYTSFKDHVYARTRDSIFKSANFDTWQKLDLSINVPLHSYKFRMQNIGNRQLWISDDSLTYVTTDNLNFERHPKKIKVLSSLFFSKDNWLVYGEQDGWDRDFFVTTNAGRTFRRGPLWEAPEDLLTTDYGQHVMIKNSHDTVFVFEISENIEVVDKLWFIVEDCRASKAVAVEGNKFIILNGERLFLVDMDFKTVESIDGEIPFFHYTGRDLIKTSNGVVYLINKADQIYAWQPTLPSKEEENKNAFRLLQNPVSDVATLIIPDEYKNETLNIRVVSTSGQILQNKVVTGKYQVPIDLGNKGTFIIAIFNNKTVIGQVTVVSI